MRGAIGGATRRGPGTPGARLRTRAGLSAAEAGGGPETPSIATRASAGEIGSFRVSTEGDRQAVFAAASTGSAGARGASICTDGATRRATGEGAGRGAGRSSLGAGARMGSGNGRGRGGGAFATTTGSGFGTGAGGGGSAIRSGSGKGSGSRTGSCATTCACSGTIRSALDATSLRSSARIPAKTMSPQTTTVAAALPGPASGESGGAGASASAATQKCDAP